MSTSIAVFGGSGGVGASTFAATLARAAGDAVLLDLDPVGGGIDVLCEIEDVPGARWSDLRLDGGRLDPTLLADGLPRWGPVGVLAADVPPPGPVAVGEVCVAAGELGPVVLDVPRAPSPAREAALAQASLAVLVVRADVRPLAAARCLRSTLGDVATGLLVRRGTVPVEQVPGFVGAPLLGVLPSPARVDLARLPRSLTRLAAGVLDGVDAA